MKVIDIGVRFQPLPPPRHRRKSIQQKKSEYIDMDNLNGVSVKKVFSSLIYLYTFIYIYYISRTRFVEVYFETN